MTKILITGICGFVGSTVARRLAAAGACEIHGMDNLSRPGSEQNRREITKLCTRFHHGDLRMESDLANISHVDWVIDASANPSVLAGVDGTTSGRQVVEHNLHSTINLLEFCRARNCGFLLISTSRVYSLPGLCDIPLQETSAGYELNTLVPQPDGISSAGINEQFPTTPPISLYGSTKLASEILAFEYSGAYGFPTIINRCGILAGAGQFGKPDQGILSFWIHSYAGRHPLKYIGFQGTGFQTRDCLHPSDLADLMQMQMDAPPDELQAYNVSGGLDSAFSLKQLSDWCRSEFGQHHVAASQESRTYDVPWLILDHQQASSQWDWQPRIARDAIWSEIAEFARARPDWLDIST